MFTEEDIKKADNILIKDEPNLFSSQWRWLTGVILTRDMFYVEDNYIYITKDFEGNSLNAVMSTHSVQDINIDIKIYGRWYIL